MDLPPPMPVDAATAKPPPKGPFVFPTQEVTELLEQCKASEVDAPASESTMDTFNRLGATVVVIDGPSIEASFKGYAKSITNNRDKNPVKLAECGIFGPTHRFKSPQRIDGSIALTPHALFGGSKAAEHVKRCFGIEAQQLPSLFFVPPTVPPPEETGTSLWGFYDGASATSKVFDDGCIPIALVAWTHVTIHFVPHSAELRAKWKALTSGGGFNDHKLNASPFFRGELETILADWHTDKQETISWPLLPGQVFLTHNGMPFCLSPTEGEDPNYVMQAVGFEVVQPRQKQKQRWREALTTGTWKYSKDPSEMFCAYALAPSAEKNYSTYTPTFAPMNPDDATWLTGGVVKKKTTAAPKSPDPASPAAAVASVAPASTTTTTTTTGGKLASLIALHDSLVAEIASLPPRAWDPKREEHVNGHRAANSSDRNKLTSYKKGLDSLKKNIEAAKQNVSKVDAALVQLEECKNILDGLQLAEDAAKLAKSVASAKKEFADYDAAPDLVPKSEKIAALLERCKKLKESVDADNAKRSEKKTAGGTKRSRSTAATTGEPKSPLPDVIEPVNEENVDEDMREGSELAEFMDMIEKGDAKFCVMVKKIDRDDIRNLYSKFHEEAVFLRNQVKEWPEEPINVGVISAYYDKLSWIWDKQAAGSINGKGKTTGTIELKDGSSVVFGTGAKAECQGDGCGEVEVIYADGKCKNCFFDDMKERRQNVEECAKDIKAEAKKDASLVPRRDRFIALIGTLEKLRKKAKKAKPGLEPFLHALVEAEGIAIEILGEESANVDDNADDAEEYTGGGGDGEAMDVDSDSGVVDDDVVSYESGSAQEDDDDDEDDEDEDDDQTRKNKRHKEDGEEENLAESILRAQVRTPIEKSIKQLTAAYLNGDSDTVRSRLKELAALNSIFGIKTRPKGSSNTDTPFIEWPHFFASEKKAEKKLAYLEKKMPSLEFVSFEKHLA